MFFIFLRIIYVYLTIDYCLSMVIPNENSSLSLRRLKRLTTNKQTRNNVEENLLPYQTIVLRQGQVRSDHSPTSVEAYENNLVRDQESSEFRHCLELCEVLQDNALKPNHDCIREKCLKEITGI